MSQAGSRVAGSSAETKTVGEFRGREDLLDECGLAHLPSAGDDLQVAPRFVEPGGESGGVGALEGGGRFTHDVE